VNFNPIKTLGTAPIVLYATGLGPTSPLASTGSLGAGTDPLNRLQDAVSVSIGGSSAFVLYAGLAPGLQGIYQLNTMPPASISLGNALNIEVGIYSGQAPTLPVPAGTNVANLVGLIEGLYPPTVVVAGPTGSATTIFFSALLTAGTFTASFDILPGASPFRIAAQCVSAAAGSPLAIVSINPAQNSWQATYTVPTALTSAWNFSNAGFTVLDFLTCVGNSCVPFAHGVIPLTRVDPLAAYALGLLPLPNSLSATGANATFTMSGTIPAGGHFVLNNATLPALSNFGGFFQLPYAPGLSTATYQLYVDNLLVASSTAPFTIFP
jgi:hypothetical protein